MDSDRITPELRSLVSRLPVGWEAWRGVNGVLYARRVRSSPPIVLRGATADDVMEQVNGRMKKAPGW